jgi:hypothetical protein
MDLVEVPVEQHLPGRFVELDMPFDQVGQKVIPDTMGFSITGRSRASRQRRVRAATAYAGSGPLRGTD